MPAVPVLFAALLSLRFPAHIRGPARFPDESSVSGYRISVLMIARATLRAMRRIIDGSRVVAGKGIDERGKEGQVFKHLPDRDYEQKPNQWLITTGAIDANSLRPAQILPETNRQYLNRQEMGPAAPNGYTAEEKRPMFKKTDKQQLASDTVRNAYGTEIFIDSILNNQSSQGYILGAISETLLVNYLIEKYNLHDTCNSGCVS